jgi:hypothetical protein
MTRNGTQTSGELPLSKWWTTPSAQAAIARGKAKRDGKIERMRANVAARREALDHEIWKEAA